MHSPLGSQQSRISTTDVRSCSRCPYQTPHHRRLHSYCATYRRPRLDGYLCPMAFNDCSGERVRAVAHPYILTLLVMGRPSVQRLLIAYTVDLISVLRELFNITLKPELALTVTITPYLSRDTTYCYRHCKGISRFPLLLHHPSPRPMPDLTTSTSLTFAYVITPYRTYASNPHHVYCITNSFVPLISLPHSPSTSL